MLPSSLSLQVYTFLTTSEPTTLAEIGGGIVAAYYLLPPLGKAWIDSLRGYAGESQLCAAPALKSSPALKPSPVLKFALMYHGSSGEACIFAGCVGWDCQMERAAERGIGGARGSREGHTGLNIAPI